MIELLSRQKGDYVTFETARIRKSARLWIVTQFAKLNHSGTKGTEEALVL